MAQKTTAITAAKLRAHADQAPVRLFSKAAPHAPRSPRIWAIRPTKGRTEADLDLQRDDMLAAGYRYERTIKPRRPSP